MIQRRQFAAALGIGAFVSRAHAEPGVSDSEVVFGSTGVLSGPLGSQVSAVLSGAGLAFAEARARGGINGRNVRIVSLDDQLKPDLAVANYEKLLKTDKVFGFFNCVGTATTAAAADVLQKAGAPWVAGYAVADSARDKVKGVGYFVRATTGREAQSLVQHLVTLGVNSIAVAALDNPGGKEASALLAAALTGSGQKPATSVYVKSDGSNVKDAAQALADSKARAVIMYLGGTLPGEIMKAGWQLGFSPMHYGLSIVSGELTSKVVGDKASGLALSQVMPYPWGQTDNTARDFRNLAQAAKLPVSYYSFEGYVNASVLLEALRRTGRDLTRARMMSTLRSLKMRIAGMDLDFSSDSLTGSRFVELVHVNNQGHFVR